MAPDKQQPTSVMHSGFPLQKPPATLRNKVIRECHRCKKTERFLCGRGDRKFFYTAIFRKFKVEKGLRSGEWDRPAHAVARTGSHHLAADYLSRFLSLLMVVST